MFVLSRTLAHPMCFKSLPLGSVSSFRTPYHVFGLGRFCDHCANSTCCCMKQQYVLDFKCKIPLDTGITAYVLFITPIRCVNNIPKWKYIYVEISKCSCEFLALVWNRCCLLKLPSSSKALSLARAALIYVRIQWILRLVFNISGTLCSLILMACFPSRLLS